MGEGLKTLADNIAGELNKYEEFRGEIQVRPCDREYSTLKTYEIYEGEKLLLSLDKRENKAVPHILDDRVKNIWPKVSEKFSLELREEKGLDYSYFDRDEFAAMRRARGI